MKRSIIRLTSLTKLKIDYVDNLDLLLLSYIFRSMKNDYITIDSTIFSLQGDHLVAECTYSSKSRQAITLGGLTTREETCLVSTLYYPRIELSLCYSLPSLPTVLQSLGIQKLMQWVFVITFSSPCLNIDNDFRSTFGSFTRETNETARSIRILRNNHADVALVSLSSLYLFLFFIFFRIEKERARDRVQRPFHINLHGTVDTTLMITTHDTTTTIIHRTHTQSYDQTFAPFTLITLNWQLGTAMARASRPPRPVVSSTSAGYIAPDASFIALRNVTCVTKTLPGDVSRTLM